MKTDTINTAPAKTFATSLTLVVFVVTLFLSASIMFAIQPMVGKMLLPLVGGSPAGWIVAMAFFQVMLLAGYFVAHILSKTGKVTQGIVYLAMLLAGIASMPLDLMGHVGKISASPGPTDVFLLLTFAVAVPFIALSATSSTIQRLFTASDHPYAEDPYFLYAASNFGSFSGLLLYPLLAEPLMGLHAQAQTLFGIYMTLITFAFLCVIISARKSHREKAAITKPATSETGTTPTTKKWLTWLFLSFVPSSLLMAVTVYITTDIMSAPMIWVLPLALYLMTFVIAFSRKPIISQGMVELLHVPAVITAIAVMYALKDTKTISWASMLFFLAVFTISALSCHMRLVSLRPLEENSKSLTAFYLMMSVGGAIGGVLNAFIVPLVTDRLVELPLMLAISLLLHPSVRRSSIVFYTILASTAATFLLINIDPPVLPWPRQTLVLMTFGACIALCAFFAIYDPKKALSPFSVFICGAAIIIPLAQFGVPKKDQLFMTRNFYGTIRVFERDLNINGKTETMRYMRHGTTTHGAQFTSPEMQNITPTYYPTNGPVGDAFRLFPSEHTTIVGLGVGTANCYNKGNTPFLFIEIDPAVVDVARNYFKYLSDCNPKAPAKTVIGDGRIELLKLPENSQDIIVLDAFSSDTIPTHLLTVDALEEYKARLKDKGIILLNVSNRYFNLLHIMSKNAREAGLYPRWKYFKPEDITYIYPNLWMVLAKHEDSVKILDEDNWSLKEDNENLRPWTDDYTNLMGMLEFKL